MELNPKVPPKKTNNLSFRIKNIKLIDGTELVSFVIEDSDKPKKDKNSIQLLIPFQIELVPNFLFQPLNNDTKEELDYKSESFEGDESFSEKELFRIVLYNYMPFSSDTVINLDLNKVTCIATPTKEICDLYIANYLSEIMLKYMDKDNKKKGEYINTNQKQSFAFSESWLNSIKEDFNNLK